MILRMPARRGGYCRLPDDFPDWPIWRAVAKRARAPIANVLAIVLRLDCLASRSIPRGSVVDMNATIFAASLDIRPEVVVRVRAALGAPEISWIEENAIVDFEQRNPDVRDATAAERQRRYRAKLKREREPDSPSVGIAVMVAAERVGLHAEPTERDTMRERTAVPSEAGVLPCASPAANVGTGEPVPTAATVTVVADTAETKSATGAAQDDEVRTAEPAPAAPADIPQVPRKPRAKTRAKSDTTLAASAGGSPRQLVLLVDLASTSCRWPLGDPGSPDFSFCGQRTLEGKSYCAEHARMAYAPGRSGVSNAKRP